MGKTEPMTAEMNGCEAFATNTSPTVGGLLTYASPTWTAVLYLYGVPSFDH
jgi:hypothetical protein